MGFSVLHTRSVMLETQSASKGDPVHYHCLYLTVGRGIADCFENRKRLLESHPMSNDYSYKICIQLQGIRIFLNLGLKEF